MYTGTNKTAVTSQNMIADALLNLMQQKDFRKITVKEIADTAKLSRQTFYSLFDSKEDVILFSLTVRHPLTIAEYLASRPTVTLRDFCHCFALYVARNDQFLRLLARHGQPQLLAKYAQRVHDRCDFLRERFPEAWGYTSLFLADGLAGITSRYVLENPQVDVIALEELLCLLLSGKYLGSAPAGKRK